MGSRRSERKRDFISDANMGCEDWRNQDRAAIRKDTFNPPCPALNLGDALATECRWGAGGRRSHVKPTPDYRPHRFQNISLGIGGHNPRSLRARRPEERTRMPQISYSRKTEPPSIYPGGNPRPLA